jgi:hypothetical protein
VDSFLSTFILSPRSNFITIIKINFVYESLEKWGREREKDGG